MESYDHGSYVERAIVIRSRAFRFEWLRPHVRFRNSTIGDDTTPVTYLLAVCANLVLVQRGEVLLNRRIGARSVVHEDLQRRKLVIIVRSVIAAEHARSGLVQHIAGEEDENDALSRNSRSQRNRAACEPFDVQLGPIDEGQINCAGPSGRLPRAEDEHGIGDLHHALEVDHARIFADARGRPWPAHHLTVVQIRVHISIIRDEPRVNPTRNVCGVLGGAVDRPGKRVVEDGVGHLHKGLRVVDHVDVRVDLAIAPVVRTCDPNCARKKGVGTRMRKGNH